MLHRLLLLIITTFCLNACVGAVTKTPSHTMAEIEAEKKYQQLIVAKQKIAQNKQKERHIIDMRQRLMSVSAPISEVAAHLCNRVSSADDLCVYDFVLDEEAKDINAAADGRKIYVNAAMMEFTSKDEELAIVLGHEVAHNMMGHIGKMKTNAVAGAVLGALIDALAESKGIATDGVFLRSGATIGATKHSVQFEEEADYVGLYITYNAGYDINDAPDFWRKMSLKHPEAIFVSTTHPSNPSRFLSLQKTVKEILDKDARGEELLPDIKRNVKQVNSRKVS